MTMHDMYTVKVANEYLTSMAGETVDSWELLPSDGD